MRSTGADEASFVQSLIARTRPTKSGLRTSLAQRTQYNLKSRLYERGVLDDRFLPDPAGLGLPIVAVAVGETFADGADAVRQAWAHRPEVVHLLLADGWQLGIFLLEVRRGLEQFHESLNPNGSLRSLAVVPCDSRRSSIPVYFDFEASWARRMRLAGLTAYPQGFPSSTFTEGDMAASLSARDRAALAALVSRPFGGPSQSWLKRVTVSPRESRLLEDGLVGFRTFLNPVECSKWTRDFYADFVCVLGTLRSRAATESLFSRLFQSGVPPALYASDGVRVVLATLSPGVEEGDSPDGTSQAVLLRALSPSLENIVVLRQGLGGMRIAVNQRFERLSGATPSASRPA